MSELSEKTSPKSRVLTNIYKNLFFAEKRKNKKLAVASVGLFLFGIVGGSTFQSMKQMEKPTVMASLTSSWEKMRNSRHTDIGKMQLPEIKIDKVSFINARDLGGDLTLDHILNGEIFEANEKAPEINTDNLFDLEDVL
ncbi:MAG: hypothetical protein LBQ97_08720 [Fusobacteriaceae bacterium]|jgi:hypothetical protein|nr:hypothetical protein [Fusobacteriaceae bacterium]